MKNLLIIFSILGLIGGGIVIYLFNKNTHSENKNPSYDSARLSTSDSESTTKNSDTNQNTDNSNTHTENKQESETQISEFTTKIYTKDEERQNNINITCSSLNDTYVEVGDTFSFCNTVGKATSSKGYEKADVFKDGEVIQALGGGNCQVSTTLYNAVLEVDGLDVIERHKHSNSVPYIKNGKDAAVSYGTYDFKFKNNTNNKIKISASCDSDYVYIKLFKLE